jgi:hypothetical protein
MPILASYASLCTTKHHLGLAASQIYTALAARQTARLSSVCLSEFGQLQHANDGCAGLANHCRRTRPRLTGRMRTGADDVQTDCSAVGEAFEPWSTASHLVGRVQASPLTTSQIGIAVYDHPHVLDNRCLLWAMLLTCLPTTAPAGPRNGVDTHLVRSSQP